MNEEKIYRSFKMLEIDVHSSLSEINNAYSQLKNLYSGDYIAISSLHDELTAENREEILNDIELAYSILLEHNRGNSAAYESRKNVSTSLEDDEIDEYLSRISFFRGENIKQIRTMRGIEIKEVAEKTNISRSYLENIELEKFGEMPARIYLKGFITSYAEFLGLDSAKVAGDLIKSYEEWLEDRE